MDTQKKISSQKIDFIWNDTIDDEVVEILALTIKRFKQQEKQASENSPCAPSV